ncbi:uncharacterized protein LOC113236886 [Hyposmocoma kahamanoa]|uniref:uncharacterized protein LOC113236886 n=1 Tax=Hyposmocoma kahamanoa TaxID=1477025 RepID=UPI000E6D6A46|nr:uncharacterized protein LOC113236886 [Hyposmocoma kahamanoa]
MSKQADLYVCETGHVICENCQRTGESTANRPESGDFFAEKSLPPTPDRCKKKYAEPTRTKDLASGDHYKRSKALKPKRVSKSDYIIRTVDKNTTVSIKHKKSIRAKDNLETIIEYKNANFCDNKSSCSSLSSSHSVQSLKIMEPLPKHCKVCPRPVTCPILECSKMIAMDSVMLHFHFDHSKVPRQTLVSGSPSRLLVNTCNIGTKTQCLTVFLLCDNFQGLPTNNVQSVVLNETYADCNAILLMGARMQDPTELAYTSSSVVIKKNDPSQEIDNKQVAKERFENNELLLLWLCQLENNANTYSITLLKSNKKVGHSYIGEAVHIRDQQTTLNMYQRCDCLILRGPAANRLLDKKNHFLVLVNILD